jgi:hypothetical protein
MADGDGKASSNKLLRIAMIGGIGYYILYYTETGQKLMKVFDKLENITKK